MAQSDTTAWTKFAWVNGIRPSRLWIVIGALTVGFGAESCTSSSNSASTTLIQHCTLDSDCANGQMCKTIGTSGAHTQVAMPCSMTACTSSSTCPSGLVCMQSYQIASLGYMCQGPMFCAPPCQSAGCKTGYGCQTDGSCRLLMCNEAGGQACPSTFTCDPAKAVNEPLYAQGSSVSEDGSAVARGCIHKRCNESGGFVCLDHWSCQPNTSTSGSGCVAIPCTTSGHCSDDYNYICTPTSTNTRMSGSDPQGCVSRNCEEGLACQNTVSGIVIGYCDFNGPLADSSGCAAKKCLDSNGLCWPGFICEQVSASTDARGCRVAACVNNSALCTNGKLCGPAMPGADANGCYQASTGTGGSNSVGGSITGGTSSSGTTTATGAGGSDGGVGNIGTATLSGGVPGTGGKTGGSYVGGSSGPKSASSGGNPQGGAATTMASTDTTVAGTSASSTATVSDGICVAR